jgi:hypothetical protein
VEKGLMHLGAKNKKRDLDGSYREEIQGKRWRFREFSKV